MKRSQTTDWVPLRSELPLVIIGFLDGRGLHRHREIKCLPAVIGRSEFAEVQVKDAWVSQIQCALAYKCGRLLMRDLESRHGTRVNDELVSVCELQEGDVLTIGGMTSIVILRIADQSTFDEAARNHAENSPSAIQNQGLASD